MSRLNVLFAVHDWGLGHATRDLVLIRCLLDAGHAVTIVSAGRALRLLQNELGPRCEYLELRDIPKPLSRRASLFYIKMSLAMPLVLLTFRREREFTAALQRQRRFDRIVSDTRYGVCLPDVPSFYLLHSLRQIIPGRPRRLERMVERAQRRMLSQAVKILIPDERSNGLAGELCHDVEPEWEERIEYIGILSSVARQPVEPDLDYFVSVSGAEPQRSLFEKLVLRQVDSLPGRILVTLGKPDGEPQVRQDGRITIRSYLDRQGQAEMMNRARLVISRSGYTTMMELAELGKKALLIPTVGQSEQEYLGEHHEGLRHMHCVPQRRLRLARDVELAEGYDGLPQMSPTAESVRRFLEIVTRG